MKQYLLDRLCNQNRFRIPVLCPLLIVLVTLILFLSPVNLVAQSNNVLVFEDSTGSFRKNKELPPYGEKLIIKGTAKSEIEEIYITSVYGLLTQKTKADVFGKNWSAIVGPFPLKSNVTFIIDEERKLTDREIQDLLNVLVESVNNASNKFMADNKSMTIDGFRTLVSGYIFNNKKLDSFTTRDSHPLDSVIWKEFKQSIFSKDFSPLIANLRILNKIKKDDFYRLIEKYKTTKSCADLIQRIDEDADLSSTDTTALFEVLKNDTTFSYSEFPVLYSDLLRNYLLYQAGKKELKGIIDNIKTEGAEILKKETIVLSTTTSQEILGIESFIGFDLGATYIPKLSATPFFITLSPYLCKIDPDKDYNLFESSIWCFLTPTVGFSFGNGNEKIKPIYFAGVGVRLNKIVRVAIGGTYFTPLNSDTYKWSFGLNASINTNYISEFIKSITSVQSNIQK